MKQLSALLILVLASFSALAQTYEHGHEALQLFDDKGMAAAPQWVQYWIYFMGASFVAGLLFVWKHAIARWVVGCFVLGILAGIVIAPQLGFPPLSGFIALCHLIFWSPALYQLLSKRPFLGAATPFSIWSGLITAVILFSFVFDIRDAFIYLRHVLGA